MAWPHSQDYNEAIQDPASCFADAELKQGEAAANELGLPAPCSGNFADVYAVTCATTNNKWAVKCFTREIAGLKERYREISSFLKQTPLPFMVDFTYLEQGIRVRGQWYPILKMRWVEGFALNTFVKNNLQKPQVLDVLSQIWVKLSARLRDSQIAHCDLQHGNVLLVPGSKAASLAVKLVDYDGMCVPALTMLKSAEVGHPNFQHPRRAREGIYSLEVDRFSHLVIYTALRALMAGGAPLWEKYDNGDNLLFNPADFAAPGQSAVFQELSASRDAVVKKLVDQLASAAANPLEETPLLSEVALKPATKASTAVSKTPLAPVPAAAPNVEDVFAAATAPVEVEVARTPVTHAQSKVPLLAAAGIGGAVVLAGIVGAILFFGNKTPTKTETPVAQVGSKSDKPAALDEKADTKKQPADTKEPSKAPAPEPAVPRVDPQPGNAPEGNELTALRFKDRSQVELADTSGLVDLFNDFTIEMWLRMPALPEKGASQRICGDTRQNVFGGWCLQAFSSPARGQNWQISFMVSTGAGGTSGLSSGQLQPLQWHHVALSRAKDRRLIDFYVDGKEAVRGMMLPNIKNSTSNIVLGIPKEQMYSSFTGEMRGFRVSSKARYPQPFEPAPTLTRDADTLVLLDFSKGQGDELADLSGNKHHGKITGADWPSKAAVADVKPADGDDDVKALRFKGKDHLELANSKGMLDLNGRFTFEAWLRLPANTRDVQYIAGDRFGSTRPSVSGPGPAGGWCLTSYKGNLAATDDWFFQLHVAEAPGTMSQLGFAAQRRMKPGQWHHLALVRADKFELFIDGQGSAAPLVVRCANSPINLCIGMPKDTVHTVPTSFDGDVRGLRISSNARYAGNFNPEQQFVKDADTLVLLDFSKGHGDQLVDLSGNNHHGKINGAGWTGKGVVAVDVKPAVELNQAEALRFKGRNYVELADTKGMLDLDGNFTLETWLRPELREGQVIAGDLVHQVEAQKLGFKSLGGWTINLNKNNNVQPPRYSVQFDLSTVAGVAAYVSQQITPLEWHHVAVVKVLEKIYIYVDGSANASATMKGPFSKSPLNIYLGIPKEVVRIGSFDADVRAFRISSTARYTKNFAPAQQFVKDADTLVLLDFSKGQGDQVPDLSGNNHHGKINGAEWLGKAPVAVIDQGAVKPPPAPEQPIGKPVIIRDRLSLPVGVNSYVHALSFSRDGKVLFLAGDGGVVRQWNVATGKQVGSPLKAHNGSVVSLSLSANSSVMATGGSDNLAKIWNVANGKELSAHDVTGGLAQVALAPDGKTLICAARDAYVIDLITREQRFVLKGHKGWIDALAFAPDNQRAASASSGLVKLWDTSTGQELATLPGHAGPVMALAFSPDGKTLASASSDSTVILWDLETKQQRLTLKGHLDPLSSLAYSPDGKMLLSGAGAIRFNPGRRGEIKLWDAETGRELARLQGHTDGVASVAFSPTGTVVASSGRDNAIRFWTIPKRDTLLRSK